MTKTIERPAENADALTLSGSLPLYTDARPVIAATHSNHAILDGPDSFAFAGRAPLVPITVDEFAAAALHYPIVLVGAERRAFVVAGLAEDSNLFIGKDGAYATGAYIPAYLRRYPFVFARDVEGKMRILCLDQASDRVGSTTDVGARPLFDSNEPTELTRGAMTFCQEVEAAETRTAMFVAMLDGADLLMPHQAHHQAGGGSTLLLEYFAIDPVKLDALDDETFAELRRNGALAPIYAQLLSAANWQALSIRLNVASA